MAIYGTWLCLSNPWRNGLVNIRSLLHHRSRCAFMKLLQSGCISSMITATGLDYRSFNQLLEPFQWYFDGCTPFSYDGRIRPLGGHKTGRRRLMSAELCVGLVLAWTRTNCSMHYLQIAFGLSHSLKPVDVAEVWHASVATVSVQGSKGMGCRSDCWRSPSIQSSGGGKVSIAAWCLGHLRWFKSAFAIYQRQ